MMPCAPVAPVTNAGKQVASEPSSAAVTVVARVAVAELPVQDPEEPEALPVTLPTNVPVIVPPSMEEEPTSMAPKPLLMEPAPNAPTEVIWVCEASTLSVTVPEVPPPDNPVPAVTPVMSPTVPSLVIVTWPLEPVDIPIPSPAIKY